MVDPVTSNRSITLPTVGADSGTWGGVLNSGVMGQLDLILGATQAISITSADVTLSQAQFNNAAIRISGVLTGSHSLILPLNPNSATVAVGGLFVVDNQTSGAFTVTVKTAAVGSTGVVAPQGVRTFLFSDTTNVWYADDSRLLILTNAGNPNGSVAGTAASVNNPPSVCWDYSNAVLYICTTTGSTSTAVWTSPVSPSVALNAPLNLQFTASVSANVLTVALKAANTGSDPSSGNPLSITFRSATLTSGAPVSRTISAALSIDTNAVGATLGTTSTVPFRFWIAAIDDTAGASAKVQLALINCSTSAQVQCPSEAALVTSVAMSSGATSAFTFYTETGVTITSKPWRLLGYIDYASGLVTAGTYNNAPTTVQLFGPGIKKPGETIQVAYATTSTVTNTTTGPTLTNLTVNITPTSAPNLILARAFGPLETSQSGTQQVGTAVIKRAGSTNVGSTAATLYIQNGATIATGAMEGLDAPGSASAQTYAVYITSGNASTTVSFPAAIGGGTASITVSEIMG